jgi:hypothetical protein
LLSIDVDDVQLLNDELYDQGLGQFERYLRLLIKVPRANKSSLVVIEGDYSVDPYIESVNTESVTWANQGTVDLTVNSQTVRGEWVRPEYVSNHEVKRVYNVTVTVKEGATTVRTDKFDYAVHPTSYNNGAPVWKYSADDSQIDAIEEEVEEEYVNAHQDEYTYVIDVTRNSEQDQLVHNHKPPLFSPLGLL